MWQIRQKKGILAKDLAKKLGVSASAISQWENGRDPVKMETISRIADALEVPLNALLEDDYFAGLEEIEQNDIRQREQQEDWIRSDVLSDSEQELLSVYERLNTTGKLEAIKRVTELSELEQYSIKK